MESGDSRAFGGTVRGPTPLRVPPHGTAVGVFTVTLDGCNGVGQLTGIVTSAPLLTSAFGLVGRAGPTPPAAADGEPGLVADLVDRGIVLGEPARAALSGALDRLCGGLAASLPDGLESDSVRYDWRTRQVWVDLALNLPPGRVQSVRVQPESDPSFGAVDLVPLWSTRDLVPDAAGRLRTALPFRVALRPVADCTPGPPVAPPVVRLTFGVPDAGAVRQVLYRIGVDPGRDPALLAALCLPTR